METFQYRKSRIWEMKEDKYTKSLAKNQVYPLYGDAMFVSLQGHIMAAGNQQKHLFLSFPTYA